MRAVVILVVVIGALWALDSFANGGRYTEQITKHVEALLK